MEFESPDVEKDFPGLYASESGKKSNESDFSDDSHDKPSKKDLLIGKRKDKKEKKDRGYAALEGESSAEEMDLELKSPSKTKKSKSFKFPSKKDKREKSKEKEGKEVEKEDKKKKETKVKLKLKERKKSKHGDESIDLDELPVFGISLQEAVERSRCHDGVDLPLVVRECIDYIEEHGLNHEGIYRSSGMKSKVQQLKRMYNQREPVCFYDHDPPVVTSLLKLFLRELPESVVTNDLVARFEEASSLRDTRRREEELQILMKQLPACNSLLISWIFVHMGHVIEREKQNKMNLQNVAIVLSPTMQISHRVLNAFFYHSKTLFKGIVLKKYVPPISAGSPLHPLTLPESPAGIEEELRKQESLLNEIHQEMNAGFVSKRREEQLWEVQRIITQLKRKLRMVQKAQESSQKAKVEKKPSDDEFKIDLTLQKAAKSSIDDDKDEVFETKENSEEISTKERPATEQKEVSEVEEKASEPVKHVAEIKKTEPDQRTQVNLPKAEERAKEGKDEVSTVVSSVSEESQTDADTVEDEEDHPTAHAHVTIITSREDPAKKTEMDKTEKSSVEDQDLQDLMQEQLTLKIEHEELRNLQLDLQSRIQAERLEVQRLRAELVEVQSSCGYRTFSGDSSENSSTSNSEDSDIEEDLELKMTEVMRENEALKQKKQMLCERIHEERKACLNTLVQLRLLQLQRESKHV